MKKYIILILISGLFAACESDFLNEKTFGIIKPADYFSTTSDLEKCVSALYSNGNLMYNESAALACAMGGDDVTTQSGGNKAGYLQFDLFTVQDNNDRLKNSWNGAYGTIKQANVIINNIDNFKEPADKPELLKDQKNRALGQAYFYRALSYYNLTRVFGQVPIIKELTVDYDVPKASTADLYAFIIEDLTKAESLLPVSFADAPNTSDLEKSTSNVRINSGAAKSLLASTYLSMAGYPLKDVSKYALAAAKAKEVIDSETTYGYKLLTNYADLWKWENGWLNKGNAEGVITCYFNHMAGDWSDGGTWANGNQNSPASFFPENFGGWSDVFAEITFFNEFPAGPRKDATFITKGKKSPTDPIITWKDFAYKHPYYAKFIDVPGYDMNNMGKYIDWWSSRTVQVMRYAEVLLVYAEAKAMSGGPDALAYTCLNRVRTRAGLLNATTGLSGTDFAKLVIDERKWEFAGLEPNARWFDMVRTETVEAATMKRDASEIALPGQPTKANYFAPLPASDRSLNPNL